MTETAQSIPALAELQAHPQWVLWRKEVRKGKPTKVPYNAYTGKRAESDNPASWASYSRALETQQKYPALYDGIGFMFHDDYTGIDLDSCVNEDGSIARWAQEVLARLDSYAEYSPSRTGIHIIVRGVLPALTDKHGVTRRPGLKRAVTADAQRPPAVIEMYCEGRFFTMTGHHVEGTPRTIEECEVPLLALHAELATPPIRSTKQQRRSAALRPDTLSDDTLIAKALEARDGAKFRALFVNGDTAGYSSVSEADLALCSILAFWTGRDVSRIDALFRRSALYREDKWDRNARRGETYGEGTIARVIASCTETYTASISQGSMDAAHATPALWRQTQKTESTDHEPSASHALADPASWQLPEMIVGGQLRDLVARALETLEQAETGQPTIFVQSARLVQVARDEKQRPLIIQMGVAELKNALTRSANYFRRREKSGELLLIPVSPPKELAEAILATSPCRWPFPPLDAIVETPVLRPDGTILDVPGYDSATRLYYAPHAGMETCKVALSPTAEDIQHALECIWDSIGEFPYMEQADRANALGLLLTPIVRPAIKRHIPLALIDAPKQGTGKGLLADVVAITATGEHASILTAPDNEEEWDKRITAKLMQGNTIITVDNIAGELRSAKLDAVLTANVYEGRILGQSKMIQVPNRATWLATGNNIKLGGDLPRRCYRIRLDPHVSQPWMRTGFKHEDLATYVAEHRADMIAALLTLARAWYAAGQPMASAIPALGTFTGWARMVGGILSYGGVPGFLTNLIQLYAETDEESAQWEAFLRAWLDTFGSASITVAQVSQKLSAGSAEAVAFAETLPEALQTMLKDTPQSFKLKLGKALEKHRDTCFGVDNLRLERGPNDRKKVGTWRVIEAVAGSAGSAGSASPRHVQQNSDLFSSVNEEQQEEKDAYEHRGENSLHSLRSLHSQENTLLPDMLQHGSTSGESLVSAASDAVCSEIGHATLPAPSERDDGPSLDSLRELYTTVKAQLPRFAPYGMVLWKVPGSGFEEGMVSHAQYCQRLLSCCKSGDVSRMQAAQAEMKARRLDGEQKFAGGSVV